MELIKSGTNFDFVGKTKYAFTLSALITVIAIIVVIGRGGLRYGTDFTGGVLIQVKFAKPTDIGEIRKGLEGLPIGSSTVQRFGSEGSNEFLIRPERIEGDLQSLRSGIVESLTKHFGANDVEVRRVEAVGPKVGGELRRKALLAIYYSLLFMAVYISGRFEFKWFKSAVMAGSLMAVVALGLALGLSLTVLVIAAFVLSLILCWILNLRYALGALLSLSHDVVITVGAFAITGKEMSLPIVAALLTIVGYSINDTIVIFDRIRENLRKMKRTDLRTLINVSINETLSRTILTSSTVLMVVTILYVMGGAVIHDFTFALLVGFTSGVYSTVFIASPILFMWQPHLIRSMVTKEPGTAQAAKEPASSRTVRKSDTARPAKKTSGARTTKKLKTAPASRESDK
jgi:preprotein translocase subunit SecF